MTYTIHGVLVRSRRPIRDLGKIYCRLCLEADAHTIDVSASDMEIAAGINMECEDLCTSLFQIDLLKMGTNREVAQYGLLGSRGTEHGKRVLINIALYGRTGN